MKRTLVLSALALSLALSAPAPALACGSYGAFDPQWALEQTATAAFAEEGAWADGSTVASFGAFSRVAIIDADGKRVGHVYLAQVAPREWNAIWVSRA